jgi:glucose/arabinose dehydrogenase
LLGLAVHPDFARTRFFYVYVTVGATNQVERWKLADDSKSATRDRVILAGINAAPYHDGGRIKIGPDRMLYVGTGDGTTPESAQDDKSRNGKLLKVGLDGEIPPDHLVLKGIRNLQAFDWLDAETLILADHGPSGEYRGRKGHDEIDVARAGDNLGWPAIYACESNRAMVTPLVTWESAVPPGGGAIYTGDKIPEWKGSFIVGTLKSKHLHRVVLDDKRKLVLHDVYFPDQFGRLRDVVMGPDKELYVTTSNCDGRGSCGSDKDLILRITR